MPTGGNTGVTPIGINARATVQCITLVIFLTFLTIIFEVAILLCLDKFCYIIIPALVQEHQCVCLYDCAACDAPDIFKCSNACDFFLSSQMDHFRSTPLHICDLLDDHRSPTGHFRFDLATFSDKPRHVNRQTSPIPLIPMGEFHRHWR